MYVKIGPGHHWVVVIVVVVMEIIVVVVTSFFSIPLGNGISYGVPVFFHSSWERNKSFIALASDDVFD
jgi:hypothetical protein